MTALTCPIWMDKVTPVGRVGIERMAFHKHLLSEDSRCWFRDVLPQVLRLARRISIGFWNARIRRGNCQSFSFQTAHASDLEFVGLAGRAISPTTQR